MRARIVALVFLCTSLYAQQVSQPSLTIYNQDFAVVRQEVPLELKPGENQIHVNDITLHLEPDSVILRDPTGKPAISVLEQNYRADPVSQMSLLALYNRVPNYNRARQRKSNYLHRALHLVNQAISRTYTQKRSWRLDRTIAGADRKP